MAEAGAFVWKGRIDRHDHGLRWRIDGSDGCFMSKLPSAGKRLKTGESLFTTVFTRRGRAKAWRAFASPTPGSTLPVRLADIGGTLIRQKDSVHAAAKSASISVAFQGLMMTGLFGGND